MDVRQIRYFVAVAEVLSFRKAARQLFVTQPPLSRQVRQLEEELGVDLLVRDRGRVHLTESGRLFLRGARVLLKQFDQLTESVRKVGEDQGGTVKVGVGFALAERVRRVAIKYAKQCPKVDVQYKDIVSPLQSQALYRREIDVGFMRPPIDAVHLTSEPLFDEQFLVVLSKQNPLAGRATLRLAELADQPLLMSRTQSKGSRAKVLEMYREAGISPKIIPTVALPSAAGSMVVASGKGIYVVPGIALDHPHYGNENAVVPLDEPSATIQVHLAWRKNETSAAVLKFIETARQVFQSRSE